MRNNCGVLAYDKLTGELNGRSNAISLNTLAKLAQDNDFLLYPMAIPVDRSDEIEFPCIVYTDNHFEYWDTLMYNLTVFDREFMYVLSHVPIYDCLLKEEDAKHIKGCGGGSMMGGSFTGGGGSMGGFNPPTGSQVARLATMPSLSTYIRPAGANINYVSPSIAPTPSIAATAARTMAAPATTGSNSAFQVGANLGKQVGGGVSDFFSGFGNKTAGTPSISPTAGLDAINPAWENGPTFSPNWASKAMGNTMNYLTTGPNLQPNAKWGTPISTTAASTLGVNALNSPEVMNAAVEAAKNAGMAPKWAPNAMVAGPLKQNMTDLQFWGKSMSPTTAAQAAQQTAAQTNPVAKVIYDIGQQTLPGLAATATQAIMSKILASPTPDFSQLPEVQAMRDAVGQAKSRMGSLSQEEITRILTTPVGSIIPEENGYYEQAKLRLQEAYKYKKDQLARTYQSYGRLNSSEHIEAQRELDDELSSKTQEMIDQLAHEKLTLELDLKKAALAQALGIEEQAAAEIMGLANLSVEEAALKYGAEAQMISDIRNTLSQTMGGAVNTVINPTTAK